MNLNVKETAATAVMAAVICVLSPVSLPLSGGVPVSLATFAVMLAGELLGSKCGTLAVLIYIILGMTGLPVFAGYSSGAGIVFGMTGGYILGYLPLAYICGMTAEADHSSGWKSIALRAGGMLAGTAVLYLIGTVWFMKYTGMDLMASLAACVIPFLPGDFLKMAIVCVLTPRLMPAVRRLRTA